MEKPPGVEWTAIHTSPVKAPLLDGRYLTKSPMAEGSDKSSVDAHELSSSVASPGRPPRDESTYNSPRLKNGLSSQYDFDSWRTNSIQFRGSPRIPRKLNMSIEMANEAQQRLREQSEANLSMLANDVSGLHAKLRNLTGHAADLSGDYLSTPSSSLNGNRGGTSSKSPSSPIEEKLAKLHGMVERANTERDSSAMRVQELEAKLAEIITLDQQDEEGRRRAEEHALALRQRQSDTEAKLVTEERKRRVDIEHELIAVRKRCEELHGEQLQVQRRSQEEKESFRKQTEALQRLVDELTTDKALAFSDKSRAEARVGELQRDLSLYEGDKDTAVRTATQLAGKLEEYEAQLESLRTENNDLMRTSEDLRRELDDRESESKTASGQTYREAYHGTAVELERIAQSELNIRNDLEIARSQIRRLEDEAETSSTSMSTLRNRMRTIESESQKLAERNSDLLSKIEKLRLNAFASENEKVDEISSLQKDLQNTKERLAASMSEITTIAHKNNALVDQMNSIDADRVSARLNLEKVEKSNQQLRQELESKTSAIQLLIGQQDAAETLAREALAIRDDALAKLADAEADLKAKVSELKEAKSKILSTQVELDSLNKELKVEAKKMQDGQKMKYELDAVMQVLEESVKASQNYQSDTVMLQQQLSEAESKLSNMHKDLSLKSTQIIALEAEKKSAMTQISVLNEACLKLQAEIDNSALQKRAEIVEISTTLQNLQDKATSLEVENVNLNNLVAELKSELTSRDTAESKVRNASVAALEQEKEVWRLEKEVLEAAVLKAEQSDRHVENLKSEIDAHQKKVEKLQCLNRQLEEKAQRLGDEIVASSLGAMMSTNVIISAVSESVQVIRLSENLEKIKITADTANRKLQETRERLASAEVLEAQYAHRERDSQSQLNECKTIIANITEELDNLRNCPVPMQTGAKSEFNVDIDLVNKVSSQDLIEVLRAFEAQRQQLSGNVIKQINESLPSASAVAEYLPAVIQVVSSSLKRANEFERADTGEVFHSLAQLARAIELGKNIAAQINDDLGEINQSKFEDRVSPTAVHNCIPKDTEIESTLHSPTVEYAQEGIDSAKTSINALTRSEIEDVEDMRQESDIKVDSFEAKPKPRQSKTDMIEPGQAIIIPSTQTSEISIPSVVLENYEPELELEPEPEPSHNTATFSDKAQILPNGNGREISPLKEDEYTDVHTSDTMDESRNFKYIIAESESTQTIDECNNDVLQELVELPRVSVESIGSENATLSTSTPASAFSLEAPTVVRRSKSVNALLLLEKSQTMGQNTTTPTMSEEARFRADDNKISRRYSYAESPKASMEPPKRAVGWWARSAEKAKFRKSHQAENRNDSDTVLLSKKLFSSSTVEDRSIAIVKAFEDGKAPRSSLFSTSHSEERFTLDSIASESSVSDRQDTSSQAHGTPQGSEVKGVEEDDDGIAVPDFSSRKAIRQAQVDGRRKTSYDSVLNESIASNDRTTDSDDLQFEAPNATSQIRRLIISIAVVILVVMIWEVLETYFSRSLASL